MCSSQDSLEEQASQGSFVAHGCQDVLIDATNQGPAGGADHKKK